MVRSPALLVSDLAVDVEISPARMLTFRSSITGFKNASLQLLRMKTFHDQQLCRGKSYDSS